MAGIKGVVRRARSRPSPSSARPERLVLPLASPTASHQAGCAARSSPPTLSVPRAGAPLAPLRLHTLRPESRSSGHAAPPYSLGAYTQKPGRADDNGAETGKLPRPIGQPRTERRKSPRTGRAAKGQLGAALVKPGKPQKGPGRQRSSAAF